MNQVIDSKKLADAVKTRRVIEMGATVRDVAEKIGIGSATVSRIENQKDMTIESFIRVCNWLQIPACDFITVSEPNGRKKTTKK
jgi:transcriptional regulator with XRE-family HTH domain